jgi:hypothetical protein
MILHTFGKDRVTPYPIHYYPSDDEKYLSSSLCVFYPVIAELGVSSRHRKVQIIKDLEQSLAPPEQGCASPSSIAHSRHASAELEPTRSSNSATTTILLDDSHAKAALQPYNHLCVREYTRAQDLAALGLVLAPQHPQRAPLARGRIIWGKDASASA